MSRLSERRGELIDRGRTITFSWEGKSYKGHKGDTIASALYDAGVRVFSRSFKYHRPRGLMCCSGQCPNCLVEVDGEPTVRACMTPIEQGMEVNHLNAWPSLERDFLHMVGKATPSFGMQVGFYYKTFIRPRRLWPFYEKILRNAAGLGRLDEEHRRTERYEKVHRHVDVLVIGGGQSGLEAATEAASAGKHTVVVEEGLALGGRLAYGTADEMRERDALVEAARAAGVEFLQPAYAGGVYEGLLVPVFQGKTMYRFRAAELVLATGSIEQPLVFGNNDLPGIMLGGAARRLANQFRIAPGGQAVVVTSGDEGIVAAGDLAAAGVEVVAVETQAAARLAEKGRVAGAAAAHHHQVGGQRPLLAAPLHDHAADRTPALGLQRGEAGQVLDLGVLQPLIRRPLAGVGAGGQPPLFADVAVDEERQPSAECRIVRLQRVVALYEIDRA